MTTEGMIGEHRIASPILDIHTIGAGGGSIAWTDKGGLLAVGPKSAGAVPGPACYGRGGTLPTVTDAQYVLGYLDPAWFEEGELEFDAEAARTAIDQHIARPLSMDLVTAADGIYQLVNNNMAAALGVVSVERGYDPREFVLVVAGGAGPIHAAAIARELDIPLILIPRESSVFCAAGMLISDLKHDYVRTYATDIDQVDTGAVSALFRDMAATARATLTSESVPADRIDIKYSADLRYIGQFNEVEVALADGTQLTDKSVEDLSAAFHLKHDSLYGYSMPDAGVELINLRITARGKTEKPAQERHEKGAVDPDHALLGARDAWFAGDFVDTPVYEGLKLANGNRVSGPAIIVQPTTTIIVPPDFELLCDEYNNYLMYPADRNITELVNTLSNR